MNDEILQGYPISDYIETTANKRWKPDTRRYYTNCLQDLLTFTERHGEPTPASMAEWEQSLEQEYTRSAVNVHLAAANNYFKWCGRYDLLRGHTRAGPKASEDQEPTPTLTRTEYMKLLRAARSLGKHRIYLLIKLFATTGVPIQCLNQVTAELVKQAIAWSLKEQGKITSFDSDTDGLELNRQTITGEYDDYFRVLIEQAEGRHLSNEEYFPKYMKAHIDRGAILLESRYKHAGDLDKYVLETFGIGDTV